MDMNFRLESLMKKNYLLGVKSTLQGRYLILQINGHEFQTRVFNEEILSAGSDFDTAWTLIESAMNRNCLPIQF